MTLKPIPDTKNTEENQVRKYLTWVIKSAYKYKSGHLQGNITNKDSNFDPIGKASFDPNHNNLSNNTQKVILSKNAKTKINIHDSILVINKWLDK